MTSPHKPSARVHSLKLTTVALSIIAFTLIYWRVVRGYSPPLSFVPWPEPPDWVSRMYDIRWYVRGAFSAAVSGLIYLESKHHAFALWLRQALAHPSRWIALVITIALLLGSYFVQPGNLNSGDTTADITTYWMVKKAMQDGQPFVYWTNYGHLGSPALQFRNSAHYYVMALVGFVIPNLYDAIDVVLLLLHILSAALMFLYVRQLSGSPTASLVASVAWSATFYRYHIAIILGRLTIPLFLCLWPLQYYLIECLLQGTHRRSATWAGLSLTAGLMLWTHVLYGGWTSLFGIIYGAARAATIRNHLVDRRTVKDMSMVVSAHLGGALIGFYPAVPTLVERSLVGLGTLFAGQFELPPIRLENILIFDQSYLTNWYGGFIGNTIILAALVAVVLSLWLRYRSAYALMLQVGIASFLAFAPAYSPGLYDRVFHAIPFGEFIYSTKTPGNYLILAIGPLVALSGVFSHLISHAVVRWVRRKQRAYPPGQYSNADFIRERHALIVSILILVELVPLSLRVNFKYPSEYVGGAIGRRPLFSVLATSESNNARVLDIHAGESRTFLVPMFTGHPGVYGHGEDAPRSSEIVIKNLSRDLARDAAVGKIREQNKSVLYQLDIGYIITDASTISFQGLTEIARTEGAVLWRVPEHAPLVAHSGIETNARNTGVEHGLPANITGYDLSTSTVRLSFSLPKRAFVQAAYSYYPFLDVSLDGRPVEVIPANLGLIGFWADPGKHVLLLKPRLSPIRQWSLFVSAVSAVCALVLMAMSLCKYPYPRAMLVHVGILLDDRRKNAN